MQTSGRILAATAFLLALAQPAGAEQWTRQKSSPTMAEDDGMFAVGAIDADRAIIFGVESQGGNSSPLMYRTSNAGAAWAPSAVGDPSNPFGGFELWFDFEFAGETGYGIRLSGFAIKAAKSVDAGGEWADQNIEGLSDDGLTQLFALDATHVWGVGAAQVARTANGMTWEVGTIPGAPADVSLNGVTFLDASNGWVVGGAYEEIKETDPFSGEEVVVEKRVLPKGTVARTTDGGATWEVLRSTDAAVYDGVAFTTPTRGILIGWDRIGPFVLATSDGGETWDNVNLPQGPDGKSYWLFSRVRCVDPVHCWVVGSAGQEDGSVMNRPVFLFSSNGGLGWELQTVDTGMGAVVDVDFVDKHRGWAGGNFGQIWHFDDGGTVGPVEPGPGQDAGPTGDGGGGGRGPFAGVFGVFQNGEVPSVDPGGGGLPAGTDAGATDSGGTGGGGTGGGGGGAAAGDCGGGGGCEAAPAGAATTLGEWLALLLLGLGLALRRSVRRAPHLIRAALPLLAAVALGASCEGAGGGQCPAAGDVGIGGYDAAPPTDLTVPEPPQGQFCVNRLDEPVAPAPGNTAGATRRTNEGDSRVVVAREAADGGSDLWLYEPITDTFTQLTYFGDPAVNVWDPTWSPDRRQIAFVSDFGGARSPLETNLFVVNLDGSGCRQVTIGANAGHLAPDGAATGTVQGLVRKSVGQGLRQVEGATVYATTSDERHMTDANGRFVFEVPAGDGVLVFRRQTATGIDEAVKEYSVAAGETVDLGEIRTALVGEAVRLGAPTWRPDGEGFVLRAVTTMYTATGERTRSAIQSIGVDGESYTDLANRLDDPLGTPAFDPHTAELLLAVPDEGLAFTPASDPNAPRLEVPLEDWQLEARAALSPHRFLAVAVPVGTAREVLLAGADAEGELDTDVRTTFGDESLLWDGVDWAPNGRQLAVLRAGADGADLWILDANTRDLNQVTDDGSIRGMAWFGR